MEKSKHGNVGIGYDAITCLNTQCNELSLSIYLSRYAINAVGGVSWDKTLKQWALLPGAKAKPQPSYIPSVLVDDYTEACQIKSLSPKASATLARRCLQGMIRDFCNISKNRLIDEVKELRRLVDAGTSPRGVTHESVEAIDHVREIGNIGAHMEKDINLVISIDEGEADVLIQLIEMLFAEWYVARYEREQRLKRLAEISSSKTNAHGAGSA
ncbi:DUF4145 domain-containing protein [Xanthobacter autotrophicus]|uniref:DUF4145 domain-containing protein n=1 Tax=Xanthobacter autotrophicus TaxID=280 RepID=UPI00372A7503